MDAIPAFNSLTCSGLGFDSGMAAAKQKPQTTAAAAS
jgi:hypothetical protein